MSERLQKIIAASGRASRRKAEEWIAAGRVTVNGRVATLGDKADPARDRVEIDGQPLAAAGAPITLMLHKPVGVITTRSDPDGRRTVFDLLDPVHRHLFPVGRLDINSEGLLLFSNDGALAHALTHPRHEVPKTYLVRVRGLLSDEARLQLEQGLQLEDGPTRPARVAHIRQTQGHTWFELTIHEGRNRLVRRMCEAVGCQVARLIRLRVGFLELGDLPAGRWRLLSRAELTRLKRELGLTD